MKYTESFYAKRTQEFQSRGQEIEKTSKEAFCLACRGNVELLSFKESLEFFRCGENELRNLVCGRRVHPIHNIGGVLMFCRNSIEKAFREALPTQRFEPGIFITNPSPDTFDLHKT